MPIQCMSPLKCISTRVPGPIVLSLDLLARPQDTNGTVVFEIANGNCVRFANGTKRLSVAIRVSAGGTRLTHTDTLAGGGGDPAQVFPIRATVLEGGAIQDGRDVMASVTSCNCTHVGLVGGDNPVVTAHAFEPALVNVGAKNELALAPAFKESDSHRRALQAGSGRRPAKVTTARKASGKKRAGGNSAGTSAKSRPPASRLTKGQSRKKKPSGTRKDK